MLRCCVRMAMVGKTAYIKMDNAFDKNIGGVELFHIGVGLWDLREVG